MLFPELAQRSGLSLPEIFRIVDDAPKRYRSYPVDKKNGDQRIISQPARELKLFQRVLMDVLLQGLPIHKSATAYLPGASVKKNAQYHVGADVILKLDFTDFFHSIRPKDWARYARLNKLNIGEDDLESIKNILFWGRGSRHPVCLSIGAPSSPMLSNILMYEFDSLVYSLCSANEINYTRYADDITISGKDRSKILDVERDVRKILKSINSPSLKLNNEKRGLYVRGHRLSVTGLIITPNRSISIGRDRKRKISSMVHKYSIGILSLDETGRLKGYLGFSKDCEPEFLDRLSLKYGYETIKKIMQFEIPKREIN